MVDEKVEGVAKIKELTVFLIGVKNVCTITCDPRQKWKFTRTENCVKIERDNVTLRMSSIDFDENWEVTARSENNKKN